MKALITVIGTVSVLFLGCKKQDPGPNEVFMKSSSFSPSTITISAGTTIKWTNKESATHNIVSDNNGVFVSEDLNKNKTYAFTFDTPGTFKYHCTHHSGMNGTVIVQ